MFISKEQAKLDFDKSYPNFLNQKHKPLTKYKDGDKCYFKIGKKHIFLDEEDFEKTNDYYWFIVKGSHLRDYEQYVIGMNNMKCISLHSLVLGKKKGYIIDHMNRNALDNRKCNLRFATKSENMKNSHKLWKKYYYGITQFMPIDVDNST